MDIYLQLLWGDAKGVWLLDLMLKAYSTISEWEILLLHILTSIWGCQCSGLGNYNRYVVVSHSCCYNPQWHMMWRIFSYAYHLFVFLNNFLCAYCYSYILFDEVSVSFAYFLIELFVLLLMPECSLHLYCGYHSLLQFGVQIFSPTLVFSSFS